MRDPTVYSRKGIFFAAFSCGKYLIIVLQKKDIFK